MGSTELSQFSQELNQLYNGQNKDLFSLSTCFISLPSSTGLKMQKKRAFQSWLVEVVLYYLLEMLWWVFCFYLLEVLWWVFCFLRCIVFWYLMGITWSKGEKHPVRLLSGINLRWGCVVHSQCRSLLRLLPGGPYVQGTVVWGTFVGIWHWAAFTLTTLVVEMLKISRWWKNEGSFGIFQNVNMEIFKIN